MVDFLVEWGYVGLFVAAFLAGSIVPFASEVVLGVLYEMGAEPVALIVAATVGNTLGGVVCYLLGRAGNLERIERWLGVSSEKLDRVADWVRRRGAWMGLLSVLPVVGEAIVVMLGMTKTSPLWTTVAMAVGKAARYVLIVLGLAGVATIL